MDVRKQPHEGPKTCRAKTRAGTPCKQPAGWGTNHFGEGRCKLHGGKSTGPPKANKNAVKTGEYESIIFDVLDEEEKDLYYQIGLDRLQQTNDEIRLTDIRLRRMMKRIRTLQQANFTLVSYKEGIERDYTTDLKEYEGTLGQIQDIENAITRVQAHKVKLLDLKHKLEMDLGIDDKDRENIQDFIAATQLPDDDINSLFEDEDYEKE